MCRRRRREDEADVQHVRHHAFRASVSRRDEEHGEVSIKVSVKVRVKVRVTVSCQGEFPSREKSHRFSKVLIKIVKPMMERGPR